MTVNRTTLLDLPLPVTGTEAGTWGDTTNNGLSQYMDIAIAGMNSLTSANFTAGALTIANTQGDSSATNIAAGSAQYATIKVSSLAVNSTITAPSSNRSYRIINADATYSLTIKASGQTGVTFLPGQTGVVAFNGTDYVIVGVVGAGTATDNAVARFDGTTGEIIQNSVVTIADSTGDVAGVGTLTMGGNLTLNGGTANGVLYLNGSKVATSGSALTFDGTTFQYTGAANFATSTGNVGIGVTSPGTKLDVRAAAGSGGLITLVNTTAFANTNVIETSYTLNNSATGLATAAVIGVTNPAATGNSYGDIYFKTTNPTSGMQERMRLDSSGNLGLGVTPSVWAGITAAMQLGDYGNITSTGTRLWLGTNYYYNSGEKYTGTGLATRYRQSDGSHFWDNAPSGTAGNAITFTQAMTLNASGQLLLGTTTALSGGNIVVGDGSGSTSIVQYLNAGTGGSSMIGRINNSNTWFVGDTVSAIGSGTGMINYVYGANPWIVYTNASERARITSGGDLLVGTTSGTSGNGAYGVFGNSSSAGANKWAAFFGTNSSSSAAASNFGLTIGWNKSGGGGESNIVYGVSVGSAPALAFSSSDGTNTTERARITSGGSFVVAAAGNDSFTTDVGIKSLSDGRMGCVVNDATTGTNSYHLYNTNATNNGYRFYVNVNGGINNYSANNVNLSDRREKTDFAPAGEYLSKICAIPVQTYKYIDQSDNEKTLGVVAQDVQAVAPELVMESNWGTEDNPKMRLSIYQTDLQYALMKCIQEQQALITSLTARVALLEGN